MKHSLFKMQSHRIFLLFMLAMPMIIQCEIQRFEDEKTISYLDTYWAISAVLDKETKHIWIVCAQPWTENQYDPPMLFFALQQAYKQSQLKHGIGF